MAKELTVDVGPAMKSVTISVRVVGLRKLRARLWLAAKLMRFAAWVSGANCEVEVKYP